MISSSSKHTSSLFFFCLPRSQATTKLQALPSVRLPRQKAHPYPTRLPHLLRGRRLPIRRGVGRPGRQPPFKDPRVPVFSPYLEYPGGANHCGALHRLPRQRRVRYLGQLRLPGSVDDEEALDLQRRGSRTRVDWGSRSSSRGGGIPTLIS